MKLIEILFTELFDKPYNLDITRNTLTTLPKYRGYTAEFETKNGYTFEVDIEEDTFSSKNKPTFNLGFGPTDREGTIDARFQRTNDDDKQVLSSVIQHVKNFKAIADKEYTQNGYAIIFTPAEEYERGVGGYREKKGSAEKLGNMYTMMVNYLKRMDPNFSDVEFTKSTKGHHQVNFNGYKGKYLHKHPKTGIEKVDRAIDKVGRKIDKVVDPIFRKIAGIE